MPRLLSCFLLLYSLRHPDHPGRLRRRLRSRVHPPHPIDRLRLLLLELLVPTLCVGTHTGTLCVPSKATHYSYTPQNPQEALASHSSPAGGAGGPRSLVPTLC